ncbi:MAG: hypothetical protein K0S01_392 [Herbinix sp.]|jgi:hypothetical protein|nr:hypothetical protein [Herbinix sp.]
MENSESTMASGMTEIKERRGISGSTLKLIAIITMLIDHTAATIIDRTLVARGMGSLDSSNVQAVQDFFVQNAFLYGLDGVMRLIGRLGFPLFCFLLVEGFQHTHNKWKYAVRLAIFALVSEIPFDLAFTGKFYYPNYQNVFFTLLIGLLVMIGFKMIGDKARDKKWLPVLAVIGAIAVGSAFTYAIYGVVQLINRFLVGFGSESTISMGGKGVGIGILFSLIALLIYGVMCKKSSLQSASIRFADLAVLVGGMLLAQILKTDYSGFGILTIAVMYGLRKSYFKSMLGGCITLTIMSFSEITAFFTLILARYYNGKRGFNLKYVFYAFYPVHLLILHTICYFMKIV